MAVDTALRRLSIISVGNPGRGALFYPDGTVDTEDRYTRVGLYSGNISAVPQFLGPIGNISAGFNTSTHQYDMSLYFSGATSYAISPAIEAGWSFNTSSGLLTIDTDDENTFGPYTITASNASGPTAGNTFTVKVSVSSVAAYRGTRHAIGVRNYR